MAPWLARGLCVFWMKAPILWMCAAGDGVFSERILIEFTLAEHQGLKEGEDSRIRQLADEIGEKRQV